MELLEVAQFSNGIRSAKTGFIHEVRTCDRDIENPSRTKFVQFTLLTEFEGAQVHGCAEVGDGEQSTEELLLYLEQN